MNYAIIKLVIPLPFVWQGFTIHVRFPVFKEVKGMAKRKRKKTTKKQRNMKQKLKVELLGLLFIFLAIFGSGAGAISDGAFPSSLENIFRFFLGIWYVAAPLFLFATGVYLLVKRRFPNFGHRRFVGLYILLAGLLLFTHIQTFERMLLLSNDVSIIRASWDNFMDHLEGSRVTGQTGGGMIGAILFACSYYLFSAAGAKIVAVFSMMIGLVFLTDLSFGELVSKGYARIKVIYKNWHEKRAARKEEQAQQKDIVEPEPLQLEDSPADDGPEIQDFVDVAYSFDGQASEKPTKQQEKTEVETVESSTESDMTALDDSMTVTETENPAYELPSLDLLEPPTHNAQQQEKSLIQATVRKLERTFQSFGVRARVTKVHVGPAVTKYEVYPEAGVKVSRIVSLHDDLALALAAKDIRIEAPIPGKSAVGIEVPNKEVAMVSLREVMDSTVKQSSKLLFALGRDISGDSVVAELNKMPHLLIAGATGSGKSVCVNGIITTILMRAKPHEVKMMMIDPKKVELNVYNGIPHLLAPVVTDPKKASRALKKVVAEMERRYDLFSDSGTRNIEGYNEYIRKHNQANGENTQPHLPYIVVLVDELADLMMVASGDVEDSITRLAQMARAAGIHLIIATQRPSVDVITGVIKANIPSRIAFSVSSQTDSRTILDSSGAEKLLGRGDMLFMPVGASKPTRVQGAFLSDEEVERIVDHCIDQQKASYQEEMIPEDNPEVAEEVDDELYDDAVQLVTEMQSASVSMLQRRFRIGYTRAARLIDAMELRGIVGPYEGSKPRTVLVSQQSEELSQ